MIVSSLAKQPEGVEVVGSVLPQYSQAAPERGRLGFSGPAIAQQYLLLLLLLCGCECALAPTQPVNPHNTGHEQRLALEAQLFSCMQN